MATVAAVYTVEPFVRQPQDVVRVLAPSDEREKEKRPRPQDKRVWASLAKEPEEVLAEAFAEAERRDPSRHKNWVALVDGNATQLKILHKLAGQHHVESPHCHETRIDPSSRESRTRFKQRTVTATTLP